MADKAHGVGAWLSRQDLGILAAMAVVAAGLLAFAMPADQVAEGETRAFDERVLLMLRNPSNPLHPLGPPWMEDMMPDLTALGSTGVLALFTLAVVGFLVLTGKRHAAVLVTVAVVTDVLLSQALKRSFD